MRPDLRQVLERAGAEGFSHVILDGTVIPADRCREPAIGVNGEVIDLQYSGKGHVYGGSIQAVIAPGGFPCGSRGQNPVRCTTSPPPASTPCPGCTGPPRPGGPPWLTPGMTAPGRDASKWTHPNGPRWHHFKSDSPIAA